MRMSHGGSGAQARAVIDGLDAAVVTLALASDIDAIAQSDGQASGGLADAPAEQLVPLYVDHRVRGAQGQSQGHQGLGRPGEARHAGDHAEPEDLRRRALELSRPPGATRVRSEGDDAKARDFIAALFKNVPVLDTGARGATTTFAQREIGDVLIAWENEALLLLKARPDKFEIVQPSITVRAEPPVALLDANVDAKGTRKVAEAYLEFLYSPAAQAIMAKHFYRPFKPESAAKEDIEHFPAGRSVLDRGLRRLECRAGDALCRRRRVRPTPEGGKAVGLTLRSSPRKRGPRAKK